MPGPYNEALPPPPPPDPPAETPLAVTPPPDPAAETPLAVTPPPDPAAETPPAVTPADKNLFNPDPPVKVDAEQLRIRNQLTGLYVWLGLIFGAALIATVLLAWFLLQPDTAPAFCDPVPYSQTAESIRCWVVVRVSRVLPITLLYTGFAVWLARTAAWVLRLVWSSWKQLDRVSLIPIAKTAGVVPTRLLDVDDLGTRDPLHPAESGSAAALDVLRALVNKEGSK